MDGESLGERVEELVFTQVVQAAELVVLAVDRVGGSLKRTWCGLELHTSVVKGKELHVYTPSGRVGASRASSGPLVEVMSPFMPRV